MSRTRHAVDFMVTRTRCRSYGETVSYQLVGADSTGINKVSLIFSPTALNCARQYIRRVHLYISRNKTSRTTRVRTRCPLHQTASDITFLATTPWIALVSCDSNTTGASFVNDIFTLARDRGAVAAVCPPLIFFKHIHLTTAALCSSYTLSGRKHA